MKTQKQMCYEAGRKAAERFADVDWLRKHTALHHIADGLTAEQAWDVEKDINSRIGRQMSILFPDIETLEHYMSWAIKQAK